MFLVLVTCLEYLDSIVNFNSFQFRRHAFPIYLTTIRLRGVHRNLFRGWKVIRPFYAALFMLMQQNEIKILF